nr:cytochrome P450 3A41-like [Cherax quadricarinatus]
MNGNGINPIICLSNVDNDVDKHKSENLEVIEPTRGNNLLDLVRSNKDTLRNNLEITEELDSGDNEFITSNTTSEASVEVWLLVAGLVLAAYVYSRWRHSYWSSRGIPTPPFLPFLGHMHKKLAFFQSRWEYFDEVYHKYGGASLCGLYDLFLPVLMIGDPVLLKGILVKDFDHFVDRQIFRAEEGSITNKMLIRKSGDEWKALRAIMTPTFTSGKIRGMFPLVCNKADTLVSFTLKEAAQKPYIDMKDIFGRFTMDTIASCAFGIECNSFKNEEPEFAKRAAAFFGSSLTRVIKFTLFSMYPRICNALGVKIDTPSIKFFTRVVKGIIAARKAGQKREDYLDILLDTQSGHNSPTTAHENHTSITHDSSVTEIDKKIAPLSKQDGICAWGSTTSNHLKPLITQQKAAVRMITNSHSRQHTPPIFKSLNLLTIKNIHTYSCAYYIHRTIQANINPPLKLLLTNLNRTHDHNTRLRSLFDITRVHITLCKNSMHIKGPKIWNSLAEDIKVTKSENQFKTLLKSHFITLA